MYCSRLGAAVLVANLLDTSGQAKLKSEKA